MEEIQRQKVDEILKVFSEVGLLNHIILIGSWCLFFYQYLFLNFVPRLRTTDIDFYLPDAKKTSSADDLADRLSRQNFYHIQDSLTGRSELFDAGGFQIEFVTRLYRDNPVVVQVGKSGIYAETLPYVDLFDFNYVCIKLDDYEVKVASPSSFVLQKLLIFEERKEKQEKDGDALRYLMPFIESSPKNRAELQALFSSLSFRGKK